MQQSKNINHYFEAEVIEGLEPFAITELHKQFPTATIISTPKLSGAIQFSYSQNTNQLEKMKSVIAVYQVLHFAIPRPKALLGHQHLTRLIQHIHDIRALHSSDYQTFTISAAGSDSSVMQRIRTNIAAQTGLHFSDDNGDLLIRLRRAKNQQEGWEVMLRLTPRPLSVRDYRVVDFPGAVNATVAHAIATLLHPQDNQTMLNLACGSATILIEYAKLIASGQVIGCDIDKHALEIAATNIRASGQTRNTHLLLTDARQLPFDNNSIDALCADLPFGQLSGSHDDNLDLYPEVLAETARVARPDAQFVILTHEIKLMEKLLNNHHHWRTKDTIRIDLRGLHPRLFILRRK